VLLFSCVYENSSVPCVPVRCVLFRHGVHEIHGIAEYYVIMGSLELVSIMTIKQQQNLCKASGLKQ